MKDFEYRKQVGKWVGHSVGTKCYPLHYEENNLTKLQELLDKSTANPAAEMAKHGFSKSELQQAVTAQEAKVERVKQSGMTAQDINEARWKARDDIFGWQDARDRYAFQRRKVRVLVRK
jgi:hypothetical protein